MSWTAGINVGFEDGGTVDYRELQRIRADHLRSMSDAGWCRPVRCRECAWLGQALSDDEAVCGYFDTATRWNDYCSHGEVRDEGD